MLLIVDNANFIVDHRITIVDSHRFLERHESSLKTIEFEVLHANVERSLVTTWEKSVGRTIGIHRLVGLIESSKCMSKSNPTGSEMLIKSVCLLEVLPGEVVLFDQKVVGAD